MNKGDLTDYMAANSGLTKADAARALQAFIDGVTGALKGGDKVTIPGFCTMKVSDRKARTGRNPRTGDPIQIPASKAVTFKAGTQLKAAVQ